MKNRQLDTQLEREKIILKRESGRFWKIRLKAGDLPPQVGELESLGSTTLLPLPLELHLYATDLHQIWPTKTCKLSWPEYKLDWLSNRCIISDWIWNKQAVEVQQVCRSHGHGIHGLLFTTNSLLAPMCIVYFVRFCCILSSSCVWNSLGGWLCVSLALSCSHRTLLNH